MTDSAESSTIFLPCLFVFLFVNEKALPTRRKTYLIELILLIAANREAENQLETTVPSFY